LSARQVGSALGSGGWLETLGLLPAAFFLSECLEPSVFPGFDNFSKCLGPSESPDIENFSKCLGPSVFPGYDNFSKCLGPSESPDIENVTATIKVNVNEISSAGVALILLIVTVPCG
jgi:hypothetical protein